jgi:purine-nucleoside phosphorylase
VSGVQVLTYLGRTHLYEGHGPAPVVHGVRTAAQLGCRTVILTNANGSFREDWQPGTCVLIRDHLNLTATSPLVGARFVDLTDAYSPRLREVAKAVHPEFVEGVYAMFSGPHYETRAEGTMMARLGADVVGMSTVLETIAARELGLEVLALSMVTAIEGADTGIDPAQVVAKAAESSAALGDTLARIITGLEGAP